MSGTDATSYWDSCIFLAWLKDESNRKPGEMAGVRDFVARLKRREVRIMTSVITFTEVYRAKLPAGMDTLFEDLLKRPNVGKIGVDIKVARLTRELRDYYADRKPEFKDKTLSVPDSLHVATAILYRADELHTFDENNSKRSLALIPLSGNVAGHNLKICKPIAIHPELDLK
jgi:predicted nucleic acid-binding protein